MKIIIALIIIGLYLAARQFVSHTIRRIREAKTVSPYRIKYITKIMNLSLTVFFVLVLFLVLGIEYTQLSVFISSVLAVIGVAFFAQWSILSNITASLIIFFGFPYRVGDKIRVVDKDDDISGVIEEITEFHVMIRRNGDLVTYPNNLIISKAVIKLTDSNEDGNIEH